MGNRTADYLEYIDITTGAIRRKRTGLVVRDTENIFTADNNIYVPQSVKDNFLGQMQSDLPISPEKPHYFNKTTLHPTSEHITQQPEYFANVENFSLSPADTLVPITFLDSKAKLTEDKQLIAKNKDNIADDDDTVITVESPEIVVIAERDIGQKSQILESESDLGEENGIQELKTEIEIQIPAKVDEEIIGYEGENLLQDQLKQRLEERRLEDQRLERERIAREEEQRLERERIAREEEQRLERERIAREEGERVRQQKLKEEHYNKHNAEVLARAKKQKQQEEERQKQLQKFKEYQEQQVREVLIQLEHKKQLEKQRLTEVLDKLKESVVSLELANKQATKLLSGGFFYKEHLLAREARKQLGLQKIALDNGVIPGLEKLEELEALVIGITRTAQVITQETNRLRQLEAEKAKIKPEHKIKESVKVEKTFFQKLKEKFSCCFSTDDHEPKPKMIEMVSVLHSKAQDNEIPVDPIGEHSSAATLVETDL